MLVRFLPKILDAELGFDVGMIPAPDLGAALGWRFSVFLSSILMQSKLHAAC